MITGWSAAHGRCRVSRGGAKMAEEVRWRWQNSEVVATTCSGDGIPEIEVGDEKEIVGNTLLCG